MENQEYTLASLFNNLYTGDGEVEDMRISIMQGVARKFVEDERFQSWDCEQEQGLALFTYTASVEDAFHLTHDAVGFELWKDVPWTTIYRPASLDELSPQYTPLASLQDAQEAFLRYTNDARNSILTVLSSGNIRTYRGKGTILPDSN